MLTPSDRELISAAVDGELAADERERFDRLLAGTPAAAILHAHLCQDRDRLAGVKRQPAPAALYPTIMANVVTITPARARYRRPSWVSYAVAASFLLAVSGGAYMAVRKPDAGRPIAKQKPIAPAPETPELLQPVDDGERLAVVPEPELAPLPRPELPTIDDKPAVAVLPPVTPIPDPPKPVDVLAAPPLPEPKPFDHVRVQLPLLLPFDEVGRDDGRAAVREQLAGSSVVRIDLFAKDTVRAAELLLATASATKTTLMVETIAGERIKRKMPSAWAVFSDGHTADDLAAWLAALATADAASTSRVFSALHVVPAGPADGKECASLFGIDPTAKKPRPTVAPKGVSAGTLDSVTAAVGGERAAVLVTYLPAAARPNPALSRELRAYLERKGERKPGAVGLLLVIRPANG